MISAIITMRMINPIVAKPESRDPHISDVNKILGKKNEKRKKV